MNTQALRIVVASPSDVQAERDLLSNNVIPELNQSVFRNSGLILQLDRWEDVVPPGFHRDGPQAWIDQFLQITDCQILVCIFWKRFGFPTPDGTTGTEHEFLTAYEAWSQKGSPQIMVYFKESLGSMPTRSEMDQMQKVLDFKEKLQKQGQGLYRTYQDETDFERQIRQHLIQIIQSLRQTTNENQMSSTLNKAPTSSSKAEAISTADVLLVTVTKVETQAVLQAAKMYTQSEPHKEFRGNLTYYQLGSIGGAMTWLIRSEMGSGGAGGSILTISEAIRELSPQAVIMVGIAFGVDPEKQPIGQVLVSRQILDYELQRVGLTVIPRGDKPQASPRLLDRFRDGELGWDEAEIKFGLVLSVAKLVDNIDFRDQLRALEPEALGGEMEGSGLYAAAMREKKDWILVKAVCDYADGNKHVDKEKHQQKAAQNAARFVLFVINSGGFVTQREGSVVQKPQTSTVEVRDLTVEPRDLIEKLNRILPVQLSQLILILNMPPAIRPGNNSPHGERVIALIEWAQSETGPGLGTIQEQLIKLVR